MYAKNAWVYTDSVFYKINSYRRGPYFRISFKSSANPAWFSDLR